MLDLGGHVLLVYITLVDRKSAILLLTLVKGLLQDAQLIVRHVRLNRVTVAHVSSDPTLKRYDLVDTAIRRQCPCAISVPKIAE